MADRSSKIPWILTMLLFVAAPAQATSDEPTELWWDEMRGLDYESGAVTNRLREVDGTSVKVPGWAVPLDSDSPMTVKTFVLVPGFGMCVHVPPPPPNQMVYVELPEPVHFQELLGPLWITGTIAIVETQSRFGAVSYTMQGDAIETYKEPR